MNLRKVTAIIPCYNEEEGIADVIAGFPRDRLKAAGYTLEVLVIDNNSTDQTAEVARAAGATVIHEPKKGKGNAIRTGFYSISEDTDYVVMLDGDDTYPAQEVLRLLEPIEAGFSNVIIGSRLAGRITDGSMSTFNRLGNWVFSHLVRYVYRVNVTDVLTGYFAWTREVVEKLRPHLQSNGFAIEMEMVTKMARLGEEIYSVPINYNARAGESNLRPIHDGSRILKMFLGNLRWKPKAARPQRIAFVSDSVMPYHKGGKEKRLYEISKRLVGDGREVHIYTMKWWDGPQTVQHDGVHFHAISKLHPLYHHGRRSMPQAIWFGLATFKLLFVKFDVIDVDSMPFFPLIPARIVCWLKGKRLHATWHEVTSRRVWQEYIGRLGIVGFMVERFVQGLPDVIISNSDHTTARLRAAGVKKDIKTIPLGVHLEHVYAALVKPEKSDVIFVGRLLAHKNADKLVRAIARVKRNKPAVRCIIVGTGPELDKLKALTRTLDLQTNVIFLGSIESHDDLYGLMKASKMLVLPSVREGFGLVAIEANAAGIPVITTSHEDNATRALIHEGINGLLAKPTAPSLARQILRVLTISHTLRPKQNIEKYDWQVVVADLEQTLGV